MGLMLLLLLLLDTRLIWLECGWWAARLRRILQVASAYHSPIPSRYECSWS